MARRFFENAAGPSSFMPAVTAAVPFSVAHMQSINGARHATQPFVGAAKMPPEPLNELWKARGSPRVENSQSPVPTAWIAEFGATGAIPPGALEHQSLRNSELTSLRALRLCKC